MKIAVVVTLAGALLLTGCAGSTEQTAQTVTASVTATETTTATATLTPQPAGTVTVVATVSQTQVQTATVTEPAPGPATAFTDGTYLVGSEVQPGTYKASDPGCYWKRVKADGDIIDNDFGTVMTIQRTDFAVDTDGCGNWSKVR